MKEINKIPYLGAGIGLRLEIANETLAHFYEIDVVEIIAEHYFSARRFAQTQELLEKARDTFSVIPHGVDLSIASAAPLETWYLDEARDLTDMLGAHYYSDHFALTRDGDQLDIGHLSPIWYTNELLENVVQRVHTVQNHTGKPLVLENITAPFTIPGGDFEEPEFISEVCRRTECGLLLDVTNIFINSHNHKFNAQKMLERYPMDSVVQMHLAGGTFEHEFMVDSHSQELDGVNEGVWPLFEWAVQHSDVKAVVIERDDDFRKDFEDIVLKDLRRIKSILASAGRGRAQ